MLAKQSILNKISAFILLILIVGLTWNLGFNTPRSSFGLLFSQYASLFILFYLFWLNKWEFKFSFFLVMAIVLRLILLNALPEFSNDFYRFIWDGELLANGKNPFAHKPDEIINNFAIYGSEYKRLLYLGMGTLSQEHYTCYPVLNQILFFIPAYFSDTIIGNVIGLRIIIIFGDIGAIYFGYKILQALKMPTHYIWLYALNPFVILEFTGNLHFEGVMIFFLLGGIYAILKMNWIWAGVFFALAIQVKLLPLMLLPFVLKKLKWRFSIGFLAVVALVSLLLSGLMLNETYFANMMTSVNEYFIRFQFNASIFYIIREIGFATVGWDPIQIVGPFLSLLATILILLLAVLKAFRNDLDIIKGMLFALMIYYLFATTVHPWYIGTVLALSIFTRYKFGLIWSFLVMLSYAAYSDPLIVKENPVFLIAEYSLVIAVMIYEIRKYSEGNSIALQFKSFFSSH